MDNNLPMWRQKLKASQSKESKIASNRWIQIANVSRNNLPRVRTVVFRGWLNNNTMLIYTDKRSEKFKDLEFIDDQLRLLHFRPRFEDGTAILSEGILVY